MKEFLRQFAPPILVDFYRKLSVDGESLYWKLIGTDKKGSNKASYEDEELVKVVVEKNSIFRSQLKSEKIFELDSTRILIPFLAMARKDNLNVLDFGGGAGHHHAVIESFLGENIRWNIVETEAMVREASRLSSESLRFFCNIEDAARELDDIDLIFTSSALQYCENPLGTLSKLVRLNARYLFVTRTPFSCLDKIITESYNILFRTTEGHGVFENKDAKVKMDGYFCELRS
jgi:putative methyltransferase (TIGR04325 family)